MQKTYIPKADEITQQWYVVNAEGRTLGRLATQITSALLGKLDPKFTPGVMMRNYVVVINAERVQVTGNKLEDKIYYRTSQYPGGLKSISLRNQLIKHPDRVIRSAVWGMLPHNKYGRQLIKNLRVYAGSEHPHVAQQPEILE